LGYNPQNSPGKLGFLHSGAPGIEQAKVQINRHSHRHQHQNGQAQGQYHFQKGKGEVLPTHIKAPFFPGDNNSSPFILLLPFYFDVLVPVPEVEVVVLPVVLVLLVSDELVDCPTLESKIHLVREKDVGCCVPGRFCVTVTQRAIKPSLSIVSMLTEYTHDTFVLESWSMVSNAAPETDCGVVMPEVYSAILLSQSNWAFVMSCVALAFRKPRRPNSPNTAIAPVRIARARITSRMENAAFFGDEG
jgi:hypothetical protein